MATKKISELPNATTPLAGTEELPLVQSTATRKATINDVRNGLAAASHNHTLADITDAGTAAAAATTDFATAAQGALADTATQPGDLALVATTGKYADLIDEPYPGLINAVINGGCLLSHRADMALTNTWQKGPVDLLSVKADGTVSAGDIRHMTGLFNLTQTGNACFVENATIGAGGAVLFRHRIESKDAWAFFNQGAYFSARTFHDIGSTVSYDITIRKANAVDDFSTTTQITAGTVNIANATNADVVLSISDMGDCRDGIEIEVKVNTGAITLKDVYLAELQLSIGALQRPFEFRPLALETKLVHRFLRPLVGFTGIANSASNMQTMLFHPGMRTTPVYEVTGAIAMTDAVAADFTQSSAHIGTIHENNEHHGRADIALFSGLTSGKVHIHRGTGGIILASAEL